MKKRIYTTGLFAFILFYIPLALVSEDISVTVSDRDLEIPLEGAMIQLVGEGEPVYTQEWMDRL